MVIAGSEHEPTLIIEANRMADTLTTELQNARIIDQSLRSVSLSQLYIPLCLCVFILQTQTTQPGHNTTPDTQHITRHAQASI
jgi:hypothetical protein